ncbi:MAG TPA: DNA-processing protein DprA [Stellaceae bacterium]|nr:DNA-processing protein DprA [Stellaceae bacterium]
MIASSPLNPSERLDWLRLIRTEHVGPVTFYQLLGRFGSAAAALQALPDLARRGGRRAAIAVASRAVAEQELAALDKVGATLLAWGEPGYPVALAALDDAPPLISVRGRVDLLRRRGIGVVGARNASASAQRFAREIAYDLGRAGLLVTSGLARGVDAAAHGGALMSGTAAVVAGGVDVIYPEENTALYGEIVEHGVVIAELPVGTVPQARHFPRRNRLISGISVGVLVIEAALKSGSLITARFAAEQGREVFAVPGSPLDPRCRGTNDLIRHGATLTESATDILQALEPGIGMTLAERPAARFRRKDVVQSDEEADSVPEKARNSLIERLGPSPVPVDELVRQCQVSPAVVATILLELELAGRLDRHPGNRVSFS